MSNKPELIPRNADDGMMILLWSADELLPGILVFLVGILIQQKLLCFVLAILAVRWFRKMKEGRPDGFLFHSLYWIGLVGAGKARSFQNPFVREYLD